MKFYDLNLLVKYAREYGHERVRVLGMTDTEHTICTFLFGHSDVSQDDVAEALRLDKTTVARALLTLEEKGFVARSKNPANRRKNLLSITDAGKECIAEVVNVYDSWLKSVSSCLTPEEQAQFANYSARLLTEAKKLCEEKGK